MSGGWEAVTVDMEQWNLVVCQLENLINLDCFIHSNHAKVVALTGVESPIFGHRHSHSAPLVTERQGSTDSKSRSSLSRLSSSKDSTELSPLSKGSDRLPNLSVQGNFNFCLQIDCYSFQKAFFTRSIARACVV